VHKKILKIFGCITPRHKINIDPLKKKLQNKFFVLLKKAFIRISRIESEKILYGHSCVCISPSSLYRRKSANGYSTQALASQIFWVWFGEWGGT
jgi:hypothetical protein